MGHDVDAQSSMAGLRAWLACPWIILHREPYYKEEGKLWERSWDEDMFWQYNCKDICVTTEVFDALWKELETRGLMEFYKLHYLKQMPKLLSMQIRGFRIHEHRRDRMRKTWEKKVTQAQAALEA